MHNCPYIVPVAESIAILEKKFQCLRELTKRRMETHQISLEQVAEYVTSLPFDTENMHPELLKSLGTVLYQVADHFELLGAMIYYWHYLCYDLLDDMTRTFKLDEVHNVLQVYKRDVQRFLEQTTLVEFCQTEKMKRVCPPKFTELVTEFSWPTTVKLERVEQFRRDYLRTYHLLDYAMILAFAQFIEPSRIFRVHWFVPASVTRILQESPPDDFIDWYKILLLQITEDIIYLSNRIRVCHFVTPVILYLHVYMYLVYIIKFSI